MPASVAASHAEQLDRRGTAMHRYVAVLVDIFDFARRARQTSQANNRR